MDKLFTKLAVAFGVSIAVNENVNLEPLWTALITLAVSVITVLSIEGVAWLRAWLSKQKAKADSEKESYEHKCEEADEICQIAEAEKEKEE